jgi:hypothetical protein
LLGTEASGQQISDGPVGLDGTIEDANSDRAFGGGRVHDKNLLTTTIRTVLRQPAWLNSCQTARSIPLL